MLHAVTTEDECRIALGAAFPSLRVTQLRYLAEGWDSTVFAVNGTHVFRFPKRAGVDVTVQKEIRLLPSLVSVVPTAIPTFDHVSGPTGAFAWHIVGYRRIGGSPASHRTGQVDESILAPVLAGTLRAIHGFPAEEAAKLGVPEYTPAAWLERHADLFARARDIARPQVPDGVLTGFCADWVSMLADPRRLAYSPELIHGDLAMEHILVDAHGILTGIIDFDDAMIADPALDFAGFPLPLAERVAAAYTDDPAQRAALLHRRGMYRLAAPLHALTAGQDLRRDDLIRDGVDALLRWYQGTGPTPENPG